MAKYECCECDADMTDEVMRRATDYAIDVKAIRRGDEELTVQATCPNGHTCSYTIR